MFSVKLEAALRALTVSEAEGGGQHGPRGAVGRGIGSMRPGSRPQVMPGGSNAGREPPAAMPKMEPSQYSLRTRFGQTVMAMAEVEGLAAGAYDDRRASQWYDAQEDADRPGTAANVQRKLKNMLKLHVGDANDMEVGMEKVGVISGLNGSRWNVYLNGRVALDSRYAPSGGMIRKAQQLKLDID